MGATIVLILLSGIIMFRNTQSIFGAFLVVAIVWVTTIKLRNNICNKIEKERFPATDINYTGILRSIPKLIFMTVVVYLWIYLISVFVGNVFLVNVICCSVYGLECLRCLYKSTLKELGYDKKQIKDILRREEEQAIEEYIKENEAKKEEH